MSEITENDDQVAEEHAHRRAQERIGPASMSARLHVAAALASRGPELEHDLTDEERHGARDVVPVGEEGPVARIRPSLGPDPAHGEDHLVRAS